MTTDNKPQRWADNWKKEAPIGGGGQGQTFQVKHKKDGRMGCLKLLKKRNAKKQDRGLAKKPCYTNRQRAKAFPSCMSPMHWGL